MALALAKDRAFEHLPVTGLNPAGDSPVPSHCGASCSLQRRRSRLVFTQRVRVASAVTSYNALLANIELPSLGQRLRQHYGCGPLSRPRYLRCQWGAGPNRRADHGFRRAYRRGSRAGHLGGWSLAIGRPQVSLRCSTDRGGVQVTPQHFPLYSIETTTVIILPHFSGCRLSWFCVGKCSWERLFSRT